MHELITKHLYQKAPNLLLENVVSIDETCIKTSFHLTNDHPLVQGHFPGSPILPGTQMIESIVQSGGLHMSEYYYPEHREKKLSIGIFRKCEQAKFVKLLRPDKEMFVEVKLMEREQDLFQYKGILRDREGQKYMSAVVKLAVIAEDVLINGM